MTDDLLATLRPAHERLERHFQELRTARDDFGGAKPIFALEHGLNTADVDAISRAVHGSLSSEGLSPKWWLPWVVYAAEIGYQYTGEEYWQTFEARTPKWTSLGDRQYIRKKFQEFATRFGGARPSGAWADQFSIICWPITHAVLPTDLQVNLVRLLYEFRSHLSAELVARPDELGQRLAANSWDSSARFRIFAENTALLGQVAAALLLGEDSPSQLLLRRTLDRIITDLSNERQARRWLTDAKTSATRVSLRGLSVGGADQRSTVKVGRVEADGHKKSPPILSLAASGNKWILLAEIPDLTQLAAMSGELRELFAKSRCIVAGVEGPPLSTGQLLYSGKRVRLDLWPGAAVPFLQLEPSSKEADGILADRCRLSPGPVWLFTVSGDSAVEVKGKVVHPGRSYLLLTETDLDQDLPQWMRTSEIACKGLFAYELHTPLNMSAGDIEQTETLGLAVVTEIDVRPVGLVPASWDGDSSIEWVEGDRAILAVSSTLDIDQIAVTFDAAPLSHMSWPPGSPVVFLSLGEMGIGSHNLKIQLAPRGMARLTEGALQVTVRPRRLTTATGTYREPLLIVANPALPKLGELWEGKAAIQVLGPSETPVSVVVSIERGGNSPTISRALRGLRLPVSRQAWLDAFDEQFRQERDMSRYFDSATALVVVASHPELGTSTLRCEREFLPLRWAVGEDHDGPYVRLHDNLGEDGLTVDRFEFAKPDVPTRITMRQAERLRSETGAMFNAQVRGFSACVILPARVRELADFGRANVHVDIAARQRTRESVIALARLARMWASAALPGNPMAVIPRNHVLRSISDRVAAILLGPQWEAAERRITVAGNPAALSSLGKALPFPPSRPQVPLWMTVERNAKSAAQWPLERRIAVLHSSFIELVPAYATGGDQWAADALLRLASSPDAVWALPPDNQDRALALALTSPIAFAAARCIVMGTRLTATNAGWSDMSIGGWEWE